MRAGVEGDSMEVGEGEKGTWEAPRRLGWSKLRLGHSTGPGNRLIRGKQKCNEFFYCTKSLELQEARIPEQ